MYQEIGQEIKEVDFSQYEITTKIHIFSKVIIDNTGEELKIYNLEGSPGIKTVAGGEVTLVNACSGRGAA